MSEREWLVAYAGQRWRALFRQPLRKTMTPTSPVTMGRGLCDLALFLVLRVAACDPGGSRNRPSPLYASR